MTQPQYAYRLGWRSLKAVVGRKDLSTTQYQTLARDLGQAMHDFNINTVKRSRMFIAQTAHESLGYIYRAEIASGAAYEGRRDLGNIHPGDGKKFKGRSYIQITGRENYVEVGKALGVDFVAHPEKLAEPKYAALAAAWWWKNHGCNQLADTGDFIAVTKRINGGTNGLGSRKAYYYKTLPVAQFLVPKRRKP